MVTTEMFILDGVPLPLSISFLHSIPDPVFSLSPIPINPGHCDSSSLLPYTAPSAASEKGMSTITMKVAYILEQARLPPGLPLGQCAVLASVAGGLLGKCFHYRKVFPLHFANFNKNGRRTMGN